MIDELESLRAAFSGHEPLLTDGDRKIRASVSLVLCEQLQDGRSDLSLLFIRRAESEGDRWSGHIAFPGGRVDAVDEDPRATAERETFEEVGIKVAKPELVARIDDLEGTGESIVVSGFIYALEQPGDPKLNHEIAEAFWLPLYEIENPVRHFERSFPYLDQELHLPALRVLDDPGRPVLWGLSYRFLQILMNKIERHLPPMPWHDDL